MEDAEDPDESAARRGLLAEAPWAAERPALQDGGVPDRQRPRRLRPVRRRRPSSASSRPRSSRSARRTCSPRPSGTRAVLAASPLQLRRLPRAVPLLHQRRGHLVPRRPPPAEPLAPRRRLPHARAPCARCSAATSTPTALACQRYPNDTTRLRPYQIEANTAIEQAIADRKRQMLVAMATGTGKTFTMVNQIYRLMKSGVGQRDPVPGGSPRAGRPGRPRLRLVRGRAGPEVRQDLRGLQPALPARRISATTRSSIPRCCPPPT